ncbi:protein of unknown function [Methylocella tundrae]|uniref:Uncharacterized protein n=1 Tax=Methylocella tundrae TaxID=227605 RepID=A0A4U8YZN8_METTU|nr:protein of unknown function [Methylocella tundrae]
MRGMSSLFSGCGPPRLIKTLHTSAYDEADGIFPVGSQKNPPIGVVWWRPPWAELRPRPAPPATGQLQRSSRAERKMTRRYPRHELDYPIQQHRRFECVNGGSSVETFCDQCACGGYSRLDDDVSGSASGRRQSRKHKLRKHGHTNFKQHVEQHIDPNEHI